MVKTMAQRMRDLREDHDLTQDKIAGLLHVDRSTVAYYETGKCMPSIRALQILSDFYGVTIDYLVNGEKG